MNRYDSIRPGQLWTDTSGKPIQAHGGSVFYENGKYYWYGENKEKTIPGSGIWHWGVRMYSSSDLYNWDDEGIICRPVPEDPDSPLHPASCMDRPHIIYCEKTGCYVLWMKIMGRDGIQYMTVAQSKRLCGPYEIEKKVSPCNMSSGDFDLVKDSCGRGYIIFERVHSDLIIADLTDDFTDTTGVFSTHMERPFPPFVREAPAHFEKDGMHYLFTSGTTGYIPNRSEVAVSEGMHGEWTVLGDPHIGDDRHNSFFSQITSVFHVPDSRLYIALADRWLMDIMDREIPDVPALFARLFDPSAPRDVKERAKAEIDSVSTNDTSRARYVWLPVEWQDGMPVLRWHDSWKTEDFM